MAEATEKIIAAIDHYHAAYDRVEQKVRALEEAVCHLEIRAANPEGPTNDAA